MRRITVLLLVVATFSTAVPRAEAAIWSGSCALSLRFNFETPIRLFGTAPDYGIHVSSLADLDVRKQGTQACAISLDPLEYSRSTVVVAGGSSTEFGCAAVVASGSWEQEWTDGSGSPSPEPMFDGSHTIDGSWGNWVLTIRDTEPSVVVGVAHLTVSPQDAAEVGECPLVGLTSVTMQGVLVFQDP